MKPAPIPDYVTGHCQIAPHGGIVPHGLSTHILRVTVTAVELREQLRLANRLVYQLRSIIIQAGMGDNNPQYAGLTAELAKWERTQL